MIIKLVIIIFVLVVIWKTVLRFRKGDITNRELTIWIIFWGLVIGATLLPKKTDIVAQWLGVERGADLLVYLSIIVLFFIIFKVIAKLEKIDRDITKVIRYQASADRNQEDRIKNQK